MLTDFDGGADAADALVIQSDGKLVAAGFSFSGPFGFALARYNSDGSLDGTFGSSGLVRTSFLTCCVNALVLQPDGKLVAAGVGRSDIGGDFDFALARYNANGSLDTDFGNGGLVLTEFGRDHESSASALVLQSDGKLVAAGQSDAGDNTFALARYFGPRPEAEPANPEILIPCKVSGCRLPIICNLEPDRGSLCINRINLIVRASAIRPSENTSAKARRSIRFAFGVANIPPGQTADVRLRLTKKGKRIVRTASRRRLRGVLEIRNTVGIPISNTPITIRLR